MTKALIDRIKIGCFGLDPIDPLRLLLDEVIEALAQPKQEPLAWISTGPASMIHWTADKPAYGDDWVPLYTAPPQRKPLTLGQKQRLWSSVGDKPTLKDRVNAYGLAIEAAHGIKE